MTLTLALSPARPEHLRLVREIDDSAARLYREAGLDLNFPSTHPFVLAEEARFQAAQRAGRLLLASRTARVPTSAGSAGVPTGETGAREAFTAQSPAEEGHHEPEALGFIVLGFVDAQPFIHQLSVRFEFMRRGVGTALIRAAQRWARQNCDTRGVGPRLWLTTYTHLSWNAPYYSRFGFVSQSEALCGPELKRILIEERHWLPAPECRVAMCDFMSGPDQS